MGGVVLTPFMLLFQLPIRVFPNTNPISYFVYIILCFYQSQFIIYLFDFPWKITKFQNEKKKKKKLKHMTYYD